jgi:hypothetical protein
LTNCRAFGNNTGIEAQTQGVGNATIRLSNSTVTQNRIGELKASSGGGLASVLGTSRGTSLISGNVTDGATTSAATLQ